ncbi:MAG: hypothetical protein IJ758_02060 [Clostridia bacterium]|nr:hypothetical protein [Clostridia bacterium]
MNNSNNFFDLSDIYNLDGQRIENDIDKVDDNLTEMLGYDFLDNVDDKKLAEIQSERELDIADRELLNNENEKNILTGDVINFKDGQFRNIKEFLSTQTNKLATIEILVGNNTIDKTGTILAVGEDYILLGKNQTGNILVCPLKNIEFIKLSD